MNFRSSFTAGYLMLGEERVIGLVSYYSFCRATAYILCMPGKTKRDLLSCFVAEWKYRYQYGPPQATLRAMENDIEEFSICNVMCNKDNTARLRRKERIPCYPAYPQTFNRIPFVDDALDMLARSGHTLSSNGKFLDLMREGMTIDKLPALLFEAGLSAEHIRKTLKNGYLPPIVQATFLHKCPKCGHLF